MTDWEKHENYGVIGNSRMTRGPLRGSIPADRGKRKVKGVEFYWQPR